MNCPFSLPRKWPWLWTAAGLVSFAVAGEQVTNPLASLAPADDGTRPLSLAEAQLIAVGRNWDLLAAAAGVEAAMAQRIAVREFPNPTLSMISSRINVDAHPNSTVAGNGWWDRSYDTVLAINQLFEIGGKRRSRRASAQAGFEAARAQFFDAKRTLDLGVTKAYVAVAQAEENARVLKQSAGTLRQEAALAEVRLKAGEISTADKSQIEITAERFELDARAAESTAQQARVALELLLGRPHPRGEMVLSESLAALCDKTAPPGTNPLGAGRADVIAAEAAVRKAQADLRLQKAARIPDPTLLAQYEHQPPDTPNTVGLGLSFPLPLWNRNRGSILAAEAALEQEQLALAKVRAQAAADIATARFVYDDAQQRWRNYRDQIRPKSEQILRTIAYAYEKGGASLLDLLTAERNDNEVRLAAAQAASDTAVAVAALHAATLAVQISQITK
jgi:cobalt-zinc-cadmium efflux system outer membrane protein